MTSPPAARRSAPAAVPDDERVVRAMLLRAVEPGTAPILRLVEAAGPHAALEAILRGLSIAQLDVDGMRARIADPDAGHRDLADAAGIGARLVIPSDPEWPAGLRDLDPLGLGSLGLYVRGELPDVAAYVDRSVAVVGTRAASEYGVQVAAELGLGLAERGWAVVSGLAYGIDGAAHRGALAAAGGAGTLAVLACGSDTAYPRGHGRMLDQILTTGGAVVSEHPPGTAPYRTRFLIRNRLIAALSRGTVVVEAAARSGARSTARYASALGRALMAVPGPVTAQTSVGCHQLLRDDPAVGLVTSIDDVIEMVGEIGELAPRAQGPTRARDQLDMITGRVLDAVPVRRPAAIGTIAAAAGVSIVRTEDALRRLAEDGFVASAGDGWRLSAAAAGERRAARDPTEALDLDWW